MHSKFIFLAACAAMLAVVSGAFGAHALKKSLTSEMLSVYKTAVDYQLWHALGLGMIGLLLEIKGQIKLLQFAGWLMFIGIVLFSGSLYLLTLLNIKWLGIITPFGGLAFILAWLLLAIFCLRSPTAVIGQKNT